MCGIIEVLDDSFVACLLLLQGLHVIGAEHLTQELLVLLYSGNSWKVLEN